MVQGILGITTPQTNTVYYFPPADGSTAMMPSFLPSFSSANTDSYYFLPRCDGNSTTTTTPGVYWFSTGTADLELPGTPSINSENSVLVLSDSNTPLVHESGKATWVLNAPTSGPYQGIAMTAQPCDPAKDPNSATINGSAGSSIVGVLDLPCADLTLSGDSANLPLVNGVVVGWEISTQGNAATLVSYNPTGTPADKGSVLVE
jgi:hypothetical protein